MDDLRESGESEQEADNVTLLHADPEQTRRRDLIIEKARGGSTGFVSVAWAPEFTTFENSKDDQPHWSDAAQ